MMPRAVSRALALLVVAATLVSCAYDAPRGAAARSSGNFDLAARNFEALRTVRIRVELPDKTTGSADVRLPDSFVVQSGPPDGAWVRDALAAVRALARATDRSWTEETSLTGFTVERWTYAVGAQRGDVWLSLRDALPRRIEIRAAQGTTAYTYADFDATLAVPR